MLDDSVRHDCVKGFFFGHVEAVPSAILQSSMPRDTRLLMFVLTISAVQGCQRDGATRDSEPESLHQPALATRASADAAADGASVDAEDQRREVTITASGDVLIHRRVLDSARAHEGGFEYTLGALGQAIDAVEGPQVTLVNLETPLTEAYEDPFNANPPVLGSPPELAGVLKALGVDVVSVANNHALDQTSDGLSDTLQTVHDAQLGVVGAGGDRDEALQPWIVKRGGLSVGFLGFAGHVNRGPGRRAKKLVHIARLRDEDEALEAIARVRKQVDVMVVAAHWSHDFARQPVKNQRQLARAMVKAGADVIIGTGPHVLQDVERLPSPRGEAIVAYSLGNAISNQGLHYKVGHRIRPEEHPVAITPGTRDVVLLAVKIRSPEPDRVDVISVEAQVMWIVNNFWERRLTDEVPVDIRLERLSEVEEDLRTERLKVVGETLGSEVRLIP